MKRSHHSAIVCNGSLYAIRGMNGAEEQHMNIEKVAIEDLVELTTHP